MKVLSDQYKTDIFRKKQAGQNGFLPRLFLLPTKSLLIKIHPNIILFLNNQPVCQRQSPDG